MDCDHCQRLLIDVACGDLTGPSASDVRAHASSCATCGPALSKLEGALSLVVDLPLAEPASATSERIMQLARNHALTTRTLTQAPSLERVTDRARERSLTSHTLADRVREFLSQFAMGRQVAMATVMVLVTAVGFWLVPSARQHELAGGNVVNPDPEGEAGPSNGIVPAAPLDLDLRQGRIRTREDEPTQRRMRDTTASAEAPVAAPQAEPAPSLEAAKQLAPSEPAPTTTEFAEAPPAADSDDLGGADESARKRSRSAAAENDAFAANVAPARAAAPKAAPSPAPSAAAEGYGMFDSVPLQAQAPAPAPTAASGAGRSARNEERASGSGSAVAGGAARPQASAGVPIMEAEAAPSAELSVPGDARKPTDTLSDGSDRFHAGDFQAAIELLEAAARSRNGQLPASARLSLARSYMRLGRCDAAVANYEKLLRVAPTHSDAMSEAAQCYRQLGRVTEANQWTSRARALSETKSDKSSAVRSAAPAATTPSE